MDEDKIVLIGNDSSLAQREPPLVVGIDLGGTQVRAAVLRGATLLSRVGEMTGENPTPERVIPRIFHLIQQALDEAHVSLEQIAGIGIAAPGPLDSRTGIVYAPPNLPDWKHVRLRALFEERFKLPVFVENDANAAGLGEYLFGAGQGSENMVYMTISTGIGGGVITDGRIIEGASGTGGELGHMTIDWHGERCNCGNIGCLERLSSGTAIAHMANEAIALGRGEELVAFVLAHEQDERDNTPADEAAVAQTALHVNARTVALAAADGIPIAREIIAIAAEALGVGLVNIIHIFNPEVIILGGGVTLIGDPLLEPAKAIVQQRAMKAPRDAVRIVLAQLGSDVGLVGAGALIYYYNSSKQRENYGSE
jgi:glucokinase